MVRPVVQTEVGQVMSQHCSFFSFRQTEEYHLPRMIQEITGQVRNNSSNSNLIPFARERFRLEMRSFPR